ncbi:hypothetical protein COLO4_32039 [Corchorus olitorius]|uniref:Uncharacterized protein n=1 Tax=Corchorus olitorius TaxID=93759 RepID=A0A1R3H2F0_9ROSI|nr:hypothetical protein COLO4_32039 [Corchorus olitorius]
MGPFDDSHSRETRISPRSKSKQIPFGKNEKNSMGPSVLEEQMSK